MEKTKQDSSKTTISEVLNKFPNRKKQYKATIQLLQCQDLCRSSWHPVESEIPKRKKTSTQQYNSYKAMISLEVHDMQWEDKFLRERKYKATIRPKVSVKVNNMQ